MREHQLSASSNSNETSAASPVPARALRRSARLKSTEAQTKEPEKPGKPRKLGKPGKRRPREILDTERLLRIVAEKANDTHSQGVALSCPLLDLPPEIRNYIWELVLGGETLHLWGKPFLRGHIYISESLDPRKWVANGVWSCTKCLRSERPEQQAESFKSTEECRGSLESIDAHEQCCKNSQHNQHNLALLLTCRQIHSDAALFPFTFNTFLFDNHYHLYHFLEFVTPKQAKAIESICLMISRDDDRDTKRPKTSAANQKLYKDKLGGLKSLTIFVEIESAHYGYGRWDAISRMRAAAAMDLKLLDLEKVNVAAFYESHDDEEDESKSVLNAFADNLEAELMRD